MAGSGRIERRLTAAIVLTALIPLLGAVFLAQSMVRSTAGRFFVPEIQTRLDESLGLYQELARADKNAMRQEAAAIAAQQDIATAVKADEPTRLESVLAAHLADHPSLVSLSVVDGDKKVASVHRDRPIAETEHTLELRRPLGGRPARETDEDEAGPSLLLVFASEKARYDGLEGMSQFVSMYGAMASRRQADERSYVLAFVVLLGLTIAAAIFIGTSLARRVSTRVTRLADATRKAGAGDLTTRVEETGSDEVTDLARAFNGMLAEIEATRARIEYLQRIGAWQEMARRLAHEIKNPLTPIQLAVEEVHQRYAGGDERYKKLLDATLEVVQAEVGTLGRLVGEFSDFARLPQAHLAPADVASFLRELAQQSSLTADGEADAGGPRMTISFDLLEGEAPAFIDRQMLRRALINLIRNSGQAVRDTGRSAGRVKVTLRRAGDYWTVDIDDDGPGIPDAMRERVFDPYVTTKDDGTGLGLAIVKKIVVEHGGVITALASPLGGARMRVTVPVRGTPAAEAALQAGSAETAPRAFTAAPSPGGVTSTEEA